MTPAYIDPGILGALYQVGYLVFYGIMAAFAFFFKPIKTFFQALTQKKKKKKGEESVEEEPVEELEEEPEEAPESQ